MSAQKIVRTFPPEAAATGRAPIPGRYRAALKQAPGALPPLTSPENGQ